MSVTIVNPVHPTPQAEQAWDRALDEALARPRGRSVAQPVVKTVAKFTPRFASVLAALLLSACAAPAFHQPAVSTPAAFKEAARRRRAHRRTQVRSAADGSTWKIAQPAESQPRGEWWKAFNDARLDSLIAQATASNQNLSVAAARVKQARAIAGIAEADRIPQVGVGVGAQRARLSPLEARVAPGTRMVARSPATRRI
jgi:multidrug efflux system outer membrane protein